VDGASERSAPDQVRGDRSYVGIVTETFPPDVNGCAMTLGHLVEWLLAQGHDVQLVRPSRHRRERAHFDGALHVVPRRSMRIPLYRIQRFGLPAPCYLHRMWHARPPDVAYVATEGPLGYSALIVAERFHIPVVSGFHTNFQNYGTYYGIPFLRPAIQSYLRSFHNRSVATLVPTAQQSRQMREGGFVNTQVLGRGVDTALYSPARRSPELRRSWGLEPDDLAVLYVGRLAEEKNIGLAAEAFRAMQKVDPRAKFVLVGDGPSREGLEKANPDFVFCGWRTGEDLAAHYASGDVFLFPSTSETFGNVTTEALASGLAVVAFNYAAAEVHINHGESGMLAAFDDREDFTRAAVALASDPDLVARLRPAARRVAEGISWDRICGQFEAILLEHARPR